MRIEGIHVDGFGHFADKSFGPIESPVSVFYGPNEAGKTTLLEFIRRILFGFPDRRTRGNLYEPLSGGRHGGSLALVSSDGRRAVVERRQGKGSGPVTVRFDDHSVGGHTALAPLLGHHSKEVFDEVFAFTIDELFSDNLLDDDNVNSQMYSAGMGADNLPKTRKALEDRRDKIYLRRGRAQEMVNLRKELENKDSALREVASNADEYGRLAALLDDLERVRDAQRARQRALQQRLDVQRNLKSAWGPWLEYVNGQAEWETLPEYENFPADAISRLENLEVRLRADLDEQDEALRALEEAEEAREAARVDNESIQQSAGVINRAQKERSAFDDHVRALPELRANLPRAEAQLGETLRELGPNWDEDRLDSFTITVDDRQQIAERAKALDRASEGLRAAEAELASAKRLLDDAEQAEGKARHESEAAPRAELDREGIRLRRGLIRKLHSQLNDLARGRDNAHNLQGQIDALVGAAGASDGAPPGRAGWPWLGAVAIVLGLALLGAGAAMGEQALIMGLVGGLALAGVGVYALVRRGEGQAGFQQSANVVPLRERLGRAEEESATLLARATEDAAPLGLDHLDAASLDAANEALDDEERRLQAWENLSKAASGAEASAAARRRQLDEASAGVARAQDEVDATRERWRVWLRERSLNESYAPQTADDLFSKVDLARERLDAARERRRGVRAAEEAIESFAAQVEPLAAAFQLEYDRGAHATVAACADRLAEMLAETRGQVAERDAAEQELVKAGRLLARREEAWRKAKKEIEALLRSGDVLDGEDVEEFRRRAQQALRRAQLEERQREAHDRLAEISGPGEPLQGLKDTLRKTRREDIEEEMRNLDERLKGEHAAADELTARLATTKSDLARLESEEESSRLRMERNIALEQLQSSAREWATLTMALNLLEEASEKFQRESQPGVLRYAETVFSQITNGRYPRASAPPGEKTIRVYDAEGRDKQPSDLSRGSREQLFLALRFGLIRELAQKAEPLPIIVDEALVNFDPVRALRAAQAFADMSRHNQILVFTCHPAIVDLFQQATSQSGMEPAQVITIA